MSAALLDSSLRALAAELKRNEGFTSWLTGSTQHADVKSALDAAVAKLRDASKDVADDDLARPFLLACATRQSGLCALGFASLQQLAASDALSPASMRALVAHLSQVDDGDDEQAQLKALQTTLTVLQAPLCSDDGAAVLPLLVVCFRLLSGPQASNAVHATAAATLRQAVSVVLQRAGDDHTDGVAAKATALLRGLCTLSRESSAPELNAPLPRAFAVDLLDDALRVHAKAFTQVPAFKELLVTVVYPLLTDLLVSSGAVPALDGAGAPSQPSAAAASTVFDEVGIDPAEVAERRCALRAATTFICTYASALPELADALFERILSTTHSVLAATWYRASAFEALQRCAADLRLARALAQPAAGAQRVQMLCRIATASFGVLTDVFGAEAELNAAEGVLQALTTYFDARAKGREVMPDVDNDALQRAHVACLALDCVIAQCSTAAHLAETPEVTTLQVVIDVCWQPLHAALTLALSRAHGESVVVEMLKAHTSLTCAAASAGNEQARDACLQCLCQLAQAAADNPAAAVDAVEAATPRMRRARSSVAAAAAAPELSPRALHCMRALLNCVLALAAGLTYAGWCPVLNALSRVDAALEVERTGTERATLATALDQLYTHIATTLPPTQLDAFIAGMRQISQREVQDAETACALLSAPGRRDGRRLFMLLRHSALTLTVPRQLPHLWLGLEQHLLATLACDAAPVRAEAAGVFGQTLLGLLDLPAEHLASPAADEAARLHGQPTFTCLLVSAFERAAAVAPADKDDVREVLLRLLLDVLERHSELLGPAWLGALRFIASSAKEADVRAEAAASTADDDEEGIAYTPLASGFACATALVQHLLPNVPPEYRGNVVDTLAAFGHQQADVNTALSAVGLVWDIADYSAREEDDNTGSASIGTRGGGVLQVLSAVFSALASLSRDPRPEIRNSAVRALATAQVAHAQRLPVTAAHAALWELLLPTAQAALSAACDHGAGDSTPVKRSSVVIMLHHSRNTASKQWEETLALCLGGLARVLRVQLAAAAKAPEFEARWSDVLSLLRDAAVSPSREVGLAAVACLGAVAASGALERKPWTQLLLVFERVAGLSACEAVRVELPAALTRLYAAQKAAFQSSDIQLLLRVADAVARTQPPAGSRALVVDGELTPQQSAALDLIRALLPLPPHAAAQYSAVFRTVGTYVRDAAASAGVDLRLQGGAGHLSPTYGKHSIELLAAMYEAAPQQARTDALPEISAAFEAAGATQSSASAAQMWLAALTALPMLLREGPAALHGSLASRDPAASEVSWHALLLAAVCLLRFNVDDSVRTALEADSAGLLVTALTNALDAVVTGALGSAGVGTAPPAVVDGFVTLVEASAKIGGGLETQQPAAMEQLCTQKLLGLVAAGSEAGGDSELAAARIVVACHALPALLRHCTALLARCVVAEARHADNGGSPLPSQAEYAAAVHALEALAQLRPSAIATDAAVMDAQQAGRGEGAAAGVLVPVLRLRASHLQGSPDRAHLLLLYGPLVEALSVRNAHLRGAVAELLGKIGGVLSLLPAS